MRNLPQEVTQNYPHAPERFTQEKDATKMKQIRGNYRKALGTGRQSGGGRLVFFFYDICSEIWSGLPATESMSSGIENNIADIEEDSKGHIVKKLMKQMTKK